MTSIVLVSVIGHVVVASICNYFLLLTILYTFCFQQTTQFVVVLFLVG